MLIGYAGNGEARAALRSSELTRLCRVVEGTLRECGTIEKPMTEPKNFWILPLLIYSKGTPNIVSIFQFSCCDEIIFPLPISQIGGIESLKADK